MSVGTFISSLWGLLTSDEDSDFEKRLWKGNKYTEEETAWGRLWKTNGGRDWEEAEGRDFLLIVFDFKWSLVIVLCLLISVLWVALIFNDVYWFFFDF